MQTIGKVGLLVGIVLITLVIASVQIAIVRADSIGNGSQITLPIPANYTVISGTTATVIKNTSGVLLGVSTTGVQVNAVTCFDNASAASGTILTTQVLASVGGGITGIPASGIQTTNGITCQVPTAIVGTVIVYWR